MRNVTPTNTSGVKFKCGWNFKILSAILSLYLCSLTYKSHAFTDVEVILDGYAYAINSNLSINLGQQTITIPDSDLENCMRTGGLLPLNNAYFTLLTNNQAIGIDQFKYFVESRLLYLTSETSNVVCDNGIFVDQIFDQGFEQPVSPFLIFSNGFEN